MARTMKPAKTKRRAKKRRPTVAERARDLMFEGPGDLATNPKYIEGYGQPNRPVQPTGTRPAGKKSLVQLFADSPLKGLE